ncbi:MAG: bifunctional DNA-formamidopyrimidine glycosylase/DNA-(apurinic or apyrimidinic site) lyase [bacterium]|nr:bifunctional DNA-formamidopyrimidine glycosylase/DNA-(apurinic or apyrimidinic site) lyase [bacterium]
MPELPEVETIKRFLEKAIVKRKITGVEVLNRKQLLGNSKDIIGAKIKDLDRRAKYLIINLDNNKSLLIHLKLTGQLVWTVKTTGKAVFDKQIPFTGGTKLPGKTTRIIIHFDKGTLFFNDMRKLGWIKIVQSPGLNKSFEKLGPEPFGKDFSVEYLKKAFEKTSRPIKIILLDQEKIAGIGNIYANEALFMAKINPGRPAKILMPNEVKKLRQAILNVLKQGLKYGGSSAADEAYIKPDASRGNYQQHFLVYQKQGQKCLKCGKIIKRITLGGRGTFFCPACQR